MLHLGARSEIFISGFVRYLQISWGNSHNPVDCRTLLADVLKNRLFRSFRNSKEPGWAPTNTPWTYLEATRLYEVPQMSFWKITLEPKISEQSWNTQMLGQQHSRYPSRSDSRGFDWKLSQQLILFDIDRFWWINLDLEISNFRKTCFRLIRRLIERSLS